MLRPAAIALIAVMAACAALTGPDRVVPPQLRTLSLTHDLLSTNLRDGGVFFVSATAVDTSFRLPRGQRLPIAVAVSSGDQERAALYRRHCPARDRTPAGYPCFKFQVFMETGHSPLEVADQVEAIGGRFYLLSTSFAGVVVFEPEVVAQARAAVRWPGVSSAAVMGGGCPPEGPCLNSGSDLLVPIPIDTGAAIPGDGIVQVRPGDVVTATYQQPRGGDDTGQRPGAVSRMRPLSALLRRSTVLALCCAMPTAALRAQVCAGFAPLDGTRVRVSASAASYRYADALGASLAAGHRVFGALGVVRAYDEEMDATAYDVDLAIGADVGDARRRVYLCPLAAASVSIGPRDFLLYPDQDYRRIGVALGIGLAGVVGRNERIAFQPAGGIRATRLWARESYPGGHHLDSDTYFLVDGGVGLVVNDALTIRPGISVPFGFPPPQQSRFAFPFGREERELSMNIAVGINFGRRRGGTGR